MSTIGKKVRQHLASLLSILVYLQCEIPHINLARFTVQFVFLCRCQSNQQAKQKAKHPKYHDFHCKGAFLLARLPSFQSTDFDLHFLQLFKNTSVQQVKHYCGIRLLGTLPAFCFHNHFVLWWDDILGRPYSIASF